MADNVNLIVNETIDNVVINPSITTQVIDVNVTGTDTYVDISVTPNVTIVNINEITGGGGGSQDLQSVTDIGATTTNTIIINPIEEEASALILNKSGAGFGVLQINSGEDFATALKINAGTSTGIDVNSQNLSDIIDNTTIKVTNTSESFNSKGINVNTIRAIGINTISNSGINIKSNLDSIADGIIIESTTSATGIPFKITKNGIIKSQISQTGSIFAQSFLKEGYTGNNLLLDNGQSYSLNNINSKQLQLNYLDRDNSIFDAFYLRTIADGGTVEASNQLLSSLALLRSISYVAQGYTQQLNADKFVKLGGTSTQFLMADGSVTTGGGGATNLTTTQTSTNFTINSDTGTDAVVPLGNGSLAGASLNDYTTAEKALVATIPNINTNAIERVTVKLGEAINKGQAVYISSATGTNIIVSKASNTSEATSSKTLGLIETTGILNDIVNVITDGLLSGLDTNTATIGDPVFLGSSGNLLFGLSNKPVAPLHLVSIGIVTRVSATVGEIFVAIQNGFELQELHNVLINGTLANNDGLFYESSTSLWKNKPIATVLGYTPVASNTTITGATNTKITYDSKGLVTAGTTLIASDIPTIAQSQVTNLTTDLAAKQATLVSATNIKTINGNTLLGSGDLVISGSSAQTGTIIVTSGTSFTTPSTITTSTVFIIELVGAGGGGGGGVASGNGTGGGGGGYVYKKVTGLSPSTTYTCAIGIGGNGGAAASSGTAGTSTTLTIGAATFTASGGSFGLGTSASAGGAGGTGSATGATPDIVISGQTGNASGTASNTQSGGDGGNSAKGWGNGGKGVSNATAGLVGTGYGGGGSAGHGTGIVGGAGTQGIIYCQYFN